MAVTRLETTRKLNVQEQLAVSTFIAEQHARWQVNSGHQFPSIEQYRVTNDGSQIGVIENPSEIGEEETGMVLLIHSTRDVPGFPLAMIRSFDEHRLPPTVHLDD